MEIATLVAHTVGWQGTIKWSGELGGIRRKPLDISQLDGLNLIPISITPITHGLHFQYEDYKARFIK